MDIINTSKFNKESTIKLILKQIRKYYMMSHERKMERYYTDAEFRATIIERAESWNIFNAQ